MIKIVTKEKKSGEKHKFIEIFAVETDKYGMHVIGTYDVKSSGFVPAGTPYVLKDEKQAIEVVCQNYIKRHQEFIKQIESYLTPQGKS